MDTCVNIESFQFQMSVRQLLHQSWQRGLPATLWLNYTLRLSGGTALDGLNSTVCDILVLYLLSTGSSSQISFSLISTYLNEALSQCVISFGTLLNRIRHHIGQQATIQSQQYTRLLTAFTILDQHKHMLYDTFTTPSEANKCIQIDSHSSLIKCEAKNIFDMVVFVSSRLLSCLIDNTDHHSIKSSSLIRCGVSLLTDMLSNNGVTIRLLLHIKYARFHNSTFASEHVDKELVGAIHHSDTWTRLRSTMHTVLHLLRYQHHTSKHNAGGYSLPFSFILLRKRWSRLCNAYSLCRVSLSPETACLQPLSSQQPTYLAINTHVSFSLFARLNTLPLPHSCSEYYSRRLLALKQLYNCSYTLIYLDIIISHLRMCVQARESCRLLETSSMLSVLLPQVISQIQSSRNDDNASDNDDDDDDDKDNQPNDVECAICQLAMYSQMALDTFSESVTWLDIIIDSFILHDLIRMSTLTRIWSSTAYSLVRIPTSSLASFALALPPPATHNDAVTISSWNELNLLVTDLFSPDSNGSSLSLEFVIHLIDLAFTHQIWCHRVQRLVCTTLVPRSFQLEFQASMLLLNHLLKRISSATCISLLAMHNVLSDVVASLVIQWTSASVKKSDDCITLREQFLSRCHYFLLFAALEYPSLLASNSSLQYFLSLSKGISRTGVHAERHKAIAQRIVTISTQSLPANTTWADGVRKACANVTAENILVTMRFVILPNMYAKILEQEKYRGFVTMLIEAVPYIGSTLIEFICMQIEDDMAKSVSIKKHLTIIECLRATIAKLDLALFGIVFQRRLCQILAQDTRIDTLKLSAALFKHNSCLNFLVRYPDRSILLTRYAKYFLRSHISHMNACWKDISAHWPVIQECFKLLGATTFLETLVEVLLISSFRRQDATAGDSEQSDFNVGGEESKQVGDTHIFVCSLRAAELVASFITGLGGAELVTTFCVSTLPSLVSTTNRLSASALASLVSLSLCLNDMVYASASNGSFIINAVNAIGAVIITDLQNLVDAQDGQAMMSPYSTPSFGVAMLAQIASFARPNLIVPNIPLKHILVLLDRLGLYELCIALHSLDELPQCTFALARFTRAANTPKCASEEGD